MNPLQLCEPIDSKPDTGLRPSPPPPGARLLNYPRIVLTLKDKRKLDLGQDTSIGRSSLDFAAECDAMTFGGCSQIKDTTSPHGADEQMNMYGRMILQSQERASRWGKNLRTEIQRSAGNRLDHRLSLAIWKKSLPMFTFDITTPCAESLLTFYDRFLWFDPAMSSLDLPVLESLEKPGSEPDWKLTLKIPAQSGGAATQARKLLSSMNFVEQSMWPTCSDGWTGILSVWKQKAELDPYVQSVSSSQATSNLSFGTPN